MICCEENQPYGPPVDTATMFLELLCTAYEQYLRGKVAAAGVVDSVATIVSAADPTRVNLYVWYDNEFGYSSQVIRLTQLLGGVVHPKFPQ